MEDYKYLTKNMSPAEMLKATKALNGKWQMLTLLGWSVDDIADKPVIAIANTCSDICPGHVNLRQVADAVKSGINGVISLIERTINRAISLINGGISLINLIPGVNIGKIGALSLPRLAEGGYVKANTPQLAMIGDNKHQGEIVAPEDKLEDIYRKVLKEEGSGNNEKVIQLLNRIIYLLESLGFDFNLYIDSYELSKRLEKVKNKKKFATNGG